METNLKPYVVYYLWMKDVKHLKNDAHRRSDYVRQYLASNGTEAVNMLLADLNSPLIKVMGVGVGNPELPCGVDLMKL